MRVVSWNVNGLRSCARKGFLAGSVGQVRTLSVSRKFVPDSKISRMLCASLVVGTLPSLPGSVALQRRVRRDPFRARSEIHPCAVTVL